MKIENETKKTHTWENLKKLENEWIKVSEDIKELKKQLNYS